MGVSSKHPALVALVKRAVFEILPTPSCTEPQIEFTHILIPPQCLGRTVQDDPAVLLSGSPATPYIFDVYKNTPLV